MLVLSNSLLNKPIMSLRTGGAVGKTISAIIDPKNLKIEGFFAEDYFEKRTSILLTQDVRDLLNQGFVVDDHEALTDPEELVRLHDLLDLNFQLVGKQVVTTSKEKVGKVTDFAAESTTLYVQKLYVGQSLLKSLNTGQLSIDRNQIVEITNKKIVIQEILKPTKAAVPVGAPTA